MAIRPGHPFRLAAWLGLSQHLLGRNSRIEYHIALDRGVAAFAGEPPPTYELYQSVYNKDGSSPLVDAKWWKDESGVMGAVGDAL